MAEWQFLPPRVGQLVALQMTRSGHGESAAQRAPLAHERGVAGEGEAGTRGCPDLTPPPPLPLSQVEKGSMGQILVFITLFEIFGTPLNPTP